MLIGVVISFLALVGFVFAIVLLLAAVIKYGVFLFSNRGSDSRVKIAIGFIFLKDQTDDLSVVKLFCLSALLSMSLIFAASLQGG